MSELERFREACAEAFALREVLTEWRVTPEQSRTLTAECIALGWDGAYGQSDEAGALQMDDCPLPGFPRSVGVRIDMLIDPVSKGAVPVVVDA